MTATRPLPGPALFPHPVQSRATDERYTPPEIFTALGLTFDLDVAAPAGGVPWIPARQIFTATNDGLAQPWRGLVWCNPPFSNVGPWADRWIDHGAGVILFPMSVNARWLTRLLRAVPAVLLLEHVPFVHPTHTGRHVPVAVALAGAGAECVAAVRAVAEILPGILLEPIARLPPRV